MHVLALVNQKGGCGKTTTAVNLAGALSTTGSKVLLVDLDPQAHATLALGAAVENEPSLIDVLRDRVTVQEAIVTAPAGIQLLPATDVLAEFEDIAARMVAPEQVLKRRLADVAASFEFVILDCPPRTDGVLAANALRAADTAVLVIESGAFALQGAIKAIAILEDVAATLDRPFSMRAIATMFDKRMRIARDLAIGMQAQFGPLLFETMIRTSVRLREAAAAGLPVQILDPRSRATADFAALAEEVRAHAAEVSASPARRLDAGRARVAPDRDRVTDRLATHRAAQPAPSSRRPASESQKLIHDLALSARNKTP